MSNDVSTLLRGLEQGFNAIIFQPVQEFHTTCVDKQEHLRILKATVPAVLNHVMDKIAEEFNDKHSVTPKTLYGAVCTAANNVNNGLSNKLAALQEYINKLKGIKGRPSNTAIKQACGGTTGPGNATSDNS